MNKILITDADRERNKILQQFLSNVVENSSLIAPNKAAKIASIAAADYEGRQTLTTAIELLDPIGAGIETLFKMGTPKVINTHELQFEVYTAFRKMSEPNLEDLNQEGKFQNIRRKALEVITVSPPVHRDQYHININEFNYRYPGGGKYDTRANAVLALEEISKATKYLVEGVQLTLRWEAYKAIFDAKLDFNLITNKFPAGKAVDFGRDASLTVTTAKPWSDVTADIMADLENISGKIQQSSRVTPDTMIISPTNKLNLLKNTQLKEILDIRRIDVGEIALSTGAQLGLNYIGSLVINGQNLAIYVNNETYTNPKTNVVEPYFKANEVALFNRSQNYFRSYYANINSFDTPSGVERARIDFNAGGIPTLSPMQLKINSTQMMLRAHIDENASNLIVSCQAAPILVNTIPNMTGKLITGTP